MRLVKFVLIISLMFLLVHGIANSASVTNYISTIKTQQKALTDTEWESYINSYASKNDIPPIEPRIDKVWKLIPGYNGLVIDKEGTKQLLKEYNPKRVDEVIFIWEEIEPKSDLKDIGAYPIYRGNPEKPTISFMINVAWGTEYLDSILKTLSKEHVKATFFLDGSWLSKNKEMANRIVEEGHEIGNHAYSHPNMSNLTDARIREEIEKTESLIKEITGQPSQFLAPPSGDYDQRVVDIAYEMNLSTVLWTLDTIDWQKPSKETIINRIVPKVDNGYLILMHPTQSTAEALPELIKEIKEKGLKITIVSETLSTNRILNVEYLNNF